MRISNRVIRARVIDTLVAWEIPQVASDAAWTHGQLLREKSRLAVKREQVEYAEMLDASTGGQVGPTLRGQNDRISLAPQLRLLTSDQQGICVHTHTGGSSLSHYDVGALAAQPKVRAIAAVALDNWWYLAARSPGMAAPPEEAVYRAYDETMRALTPTYRDLVQTEQMSRARAWQELTHEIWMRTAAALGLLYDRVEGQPRT